MVCLISLNNRFIDAAAIRFLAPLPESKTTRGLLEKLIAVPDNGFPFITGLLSHRSWWQDPWAQKRAAEILASETQSLSKYLKPLLLNPEFAELPESAALVLARFGGESFPNHKELADLLAGPYGVNSNPPFVGGWTERPEVLAVLIGHAKTHAVHKSNDPDSQRLINRVFNSFRERPDAAIHLSGLIEECASTTACWSHLESVLRDPIWVENPSFPRVLKGIFDFGHPKTLLKARSLIDSLGSSEAWARHPGLKRIIGDEPVTFQALREGFQRESLGPKIEADLKKRLRLAFEEKLRTSGGDPACLQAAILDMLK
jgi:hypothetical protein